MQMIISLGLLKRLIAHLHEASEARKPAPVAHSSKTQFGANREQSRQTYAESMQRYAEICGVRAEISGVRAEMPTKLRLSSAAAPGNSAKLQTPLLLHLQSQRSSSGVKRR